MKVIYNSVKACVKSLGKLSDCFESLVALKQGEPLSPVMLILFLNDLAVELSINVNVFSLTEEFQKFVLLFTDDSLLLAESCMDLLNKLNIYCKTWNITVNTDKTKVLLFKCSNRPEEFELFFENIKL